VLLLEAAGGGVGAVSVDGTRTGRRSVPGQRLEQLSLQRAAVVVTATVGGHGAVRRLWLEGRCVSARHHHPSALDSAEVDCVSLVSQSAAAAAACACQHRAAQITREESFLLSSQIGSGRL
jgi:hypothetical protein